MMLVSVLSVWFVLPDVAHAQTVTIEGRSVYMSLTGRVSSATATISYTEGSGQVTAHVSGVTYNLLDPNDVITEIVQGPFVSNPTPGGASSSVNAPNGRGFFRIFSEWGYTLDINGKTYSDKIFDIKDV